MKKAASFILFVCITILCNCTGKSVLDDDACVQLALCIPDHCMNPQARSSFTDEYLNAWDAINALPDEAEEAGYLPEKEWIYYFVTRNGDCDNLQVHIMNVYRSDSIANVQFYYSCDNQSDDDIQHHTMYLVFRNGRWLIDEYDTTKRDMIAWVKDATTNTLE